MKKFLLILLVGLFIVFSILMVSNSSQTIGASTDMYSGYAKVITNSCYLLRYPTKTNELFNKYFLLEESFYVKVLDFDSEDFYKVQYDDLTGYVNKKDVALVKEKPENPYLLGITFDIHSLGEVKMLDSPTFVNSKELLTLQENTKNLIYYGKISGEETNEGLGNVWYYCSYTNANYETIKGYVYSPFACNLCEINKNTENLTTVSNSFFEPSLSLLYLSLNYRNLILIVIAIPTLVVMYLFIKPTKILKE